VTLSVPASALGNVNTAIAIPGIAAAVIDTDSESVDYLMVEGLPVGAVLSDGTRTFTAASGSTGVDVKAWTLSLLTVKSAAGSAADFTLTVRSRSKEASGPTSADATKAIAVSVNGAPTDVLLGLAAPQFKEGDVGVLVGTLSVTDPGDATGTYVYSVTGAEAARFTVRNGNQLWLAAGTTLDYEAGAVTVGIHVDDKTTGTTLPYDDAVVVRPADVNEPLIAVRDNDGAANVVADGAGVGTVVGITAYSADPDGRAVSYSLTGNPYGWFAVNATTGVVSVASGQVVQYETNQGPLSVTVQASNAGSDTLVATTFSIVVNDVNETPAFTSAASAGIAEGSYGASTVIANLTSSDPDLPTSIYGAAANRSYAIVAGDTGRFGTSGSNLIVKSGAAFDYEGVRTYALTLRVTDGGGAWSDQAFTVNVGNVNEDPYGIYDADGAGNGVTEGAGIGTYTGVTVRASDPDGDALTYAITGDQLGWFRVDPGTGAVYTRAGIDYEQTSNGLVSINVQASDPAGRAVAMNSVVIGVGDVNETPWITSGASATISENAGYGSYVATIGSADPDTAGSAYGTSGHGYAIVGGDSARFYVSGNAIYTYGGLDYEAQTAYGFAIRVTDNYGNPGAQSADQWFTAYVGNVDEKPSAPGTSDGGYDYYITENQGWSIGLVGSTDPDGTDVDYDFAAGGNPYGWFDRWQGGGNTGGLGLIGSRDFDSIRPYLTMESAHRGYVTVNVIGVDRAGTVSDPRTVRLHFDNVNDVAPSQPWVSPSTTTFEESYYGGATRTLVATIGSDDGDGGLTGVSYGLSSNPGGLFEIVGNQVWVRDGVYIDYDALTTGGTQLTTAIGVYAWDGAYGSAVADIPITFNNRNDEPTYFSTWPAEIVLTENATPGPIVGNARATDRDGFPITYSLIGNTNGFGITQSGDIFIAGIVDFEVEGNYLIDNGTHAGAKVFSLSVNATDGGYSSGTSVQVYIYDVNLQVWSPTGNGGEYLNPRYQPEWYSSYVGDGPIPNTGPSTVAAAGMPTAAGVQPGGSVSLRPGGYNSWYNEYVLRDTWTGGAIAHYGEYSNYEGQTHNRPETSANYAAGYVKSGAWGDFRVYSPDENNTNTVFAGGWPIAFDLGGDGLALTRAFEGQVFFDQNGDGMRDRTAWIGATDGLLALDRNGNGVIDDGAEIAFKGDTPGAATDLEGLAAYDSNRDGVLDASDTRFGEFLLWQDADQDGVSDAGELKTLARAGIASLALIGMPTGQTFGSGESAIVGSSTYTTADGQRRMLGDVVLGYLPASPPTAQPVALDAAVRVAYDRDGDGVIGSGEAVADEAALAGYDSNGDGAVDGADARFYDLRAWRDANANGRAEADELTGLDQVAPTGVRIAGYAAAVAKTTPEPVAPVAVAPAEIDIAPAAPAAGATALASVTDATAEIDWSHLDFDRKAKKYLLQVAGGAITVRPRKGSGVEDAAADRLGAASVLSFRNGSYGMLSPIVLDLDGDGVELQSAKKSHARFDMDGDGSRDDAGWVGKGDGLLVIDRNGDGQITDASELSFLSEVKGARSDLEGLAALDANHDGTIDAKDARFGELKVWADRNRDGTTQPGELMTLADAGIAAIGLKATAMPAQALAVGSNAVLATATFTRTNGRLATLADVALAFRPLAPVKTVTKLASNDPGDLGAASPYDDRIAAMVQAMGGFGSGFGAAVGTIERYGQAQPVTFDFFAG
jgi:hypothetical protein